MTEFRLVAHLFQLHLQTCTIEHTTLINSCFLVIDFHFFTPLQKPPAWGNGSSSASGSQPYSASLTWPNGLTWDLCSPLLVLYKNFNSTSHQHRAMSVLSNRKVTRYFFCINLWTRKIMHACILIKKYLMVNFFHHKFSI